ncbi:hypothetical protein HMSSN139_16700 [Paenibacillus sp. HMSSN-139]|nr:hypothetical protein HMSSN139_16700 [Paenibacillus sp. HMSSN-139]
MPIAGPGTFSEQVRLDADILLKRARKSADTGISDPRADFADGVPGIYQQVFAFFNANQGEVLGDA